jgi:hypothetical protein
MTINALKKLGEKVEKGYSFGRKYLPVLESPVIISIGNNNERGNCRIINYSFDVKKGYSFNRHYFA